MGAGRYGWLPVAAVVVLAAGCVERTVRPVGQQVVVRDSGASEAEARDPIARAEEQLEKDPQNPKWHFELGYLHELADELDLAELRYRSGKALVRPGLYTGPHLFLGRVLVRQGKLEEGVRELGLALAVKPRDEQGYYLNPDYREAAFLYGHAEYHLGDLSSSREAFRRYLALGGERRQVVRYFPELVAD